MHGKTEVKHKLELEIPHPYSGFYQTEGQETRAIDGGNDLARFNFS